jgi:hypothetical protein
VSADDQRLRGQSEPNYLGISRLATQALEAIHDQAGREQARRDRRRRIQETAFLLLLIVTFVYALARLTFG